MSSILAAVVEAAQMAAIVAISPLVTGVMRKVKARTQKREGPGLLQPYRDLLKLTKKEEVVSDQASWIFLWTPWIVFAATVTSTLFIPAFLSSAPLSLVGDMLLVVGLFGLARFFTMLSGLDVASAFGGLGTSREMMLSALVEPALFITIFQISLNYGGTNISAMVSSAVQAGGASGLGVITPAVIFALISFLIVLMAESGRIPFDNPATHLELTMVHEAMVLEYSGTRLALMEMAQWTKTVVLIALMADIFMPWGIASSGQVYSDATLALASPLVFVAKVVAIAAFVAFIETRVAKWRLFRLPDLLVMAMSSSLIGVMFLYV